MRLLFVDTTTDSKEIGGGHLILPVLMGELCKRGHDVHLVMANKENPKLTELISESKAVVHLAPWKKRAPVTELITVFNQWISNLKPDIYIISSSAAIGWLVLPVLNPHIPAFTIGHNNENTFYLPVTHYRDFLTRAIGVSEEICNNYKSNCKMPSAKTRWIPYGVIAADKISAPDESGCLRLIYVGRLEEQQKRISDLVAVVLALYETGVHFTLNIVGDGPEMPFVRSSLGILINKGIVSVEGWKSKNDVIKALRGADIFILTSSFEGFSIALTEAMANSCCPVVSDIKAGNQHLIQHSENGFLVPVGDIAQYVKVLQSLSTDQTLLQEYKKKAFETGVKFSIQRMAVNYEKEFEETIREVAVYPRSTVPSFPVLPACVSGYPLWLRKVKSYFATKHRV